MDTWCDVGHSLNLRLSYNKKGIMAQDGSFFLFWSWERKREVRESTKLLSSIYGDPLVRFRRVKDKSSSHQRGALVGTKKEGFRRRSKKGDSGEIVLLDLGGVLGISYRLDCASRGTDPSYSGFSLYLFRLNWWNVLRVCLGRKMPKTRRSLPRRRGSPRPAFKLCSASPRQRLRPVMACLWPSLEHVSRSYMD